MLQRFERHLALVSCLQGHENSSGRLVLSQAYHKYLPLDHVRGCPLDRDVAYDGRAGRRRCLQDCREGLLVSERCVARGVTWGEQLPEYR